MASLELWTKWRDEYYAGLKQIIDNAPYGIAKLTVESEGDLFVPDVAKAFVDKAIKEGFIKESEPLSFLKMSYFAMVGLVAYQNKEDVSVQDVEASCHEPDYPYREITTADDYISYAFLVFHLPLLKACRYVFANHPRACKNVIIDLFKQAGEEIDFSYFRLRKEELFNYFRSITPFCLHNMLADMNCPYAEEVFDAVQDGDYEFFKTLCYEKNIDFTELSEIVGYLQGGLIGSINDTEKIFESDENPDEETEEKIYSRLKNVTSMAGLPRFNQEDFKAGVTILKQNIVGELLPFIQTEGDASIISAIAFDVANMYSYIERMDDGELKEINRLLDHPDFEALVKLAQGLFCGRYDRFPNNVTIHFSPEEQNEMLSNIRDVKKVAQGDAELADAEITEHKPSDGWIITDEKTLASRWMTHLYHSMSDDVLIELISKHIWPQLSAEVDGLQWTPSKRALPTFQKTKNMLTACILFHALELAKIAKLPKQEDYAVNNEEYMSADDRAQAGISVTSNREAGIVHTKKKYNDTLPVGYMEVLKKFIPEEVLPGRTTSRTYLKLVNKWVKIKLESVRDNIDSEASAKLFIAECQKDLGPQFYLYQDNRVKMKAMLKEWKDNLPEVFNNIPI